MLVGCGLRRAEIVTVKVEDFELREDHWELADLICKGGHMRTVPIPSWVKAAVDVWMSSCLGMSRFRPPSAILGASSGFGTQSTTGSAWSRSLRDRCYSSLADI